MRHAFATASVVFLALTAASPARADVDDDPAVRILVDLNLSLCEVPDPPRRAARVELAAVRLEQCGEPALALHDMVALAPILTEAGGRFTSLDGEDGPFGGDAVATNGLLHEEVLEALAERRG